ncbi:PHP domain-containing protein [Aestuariimicrobium sp. T2.26MG-19.2B]|uniref:PHP domain-containing protein n=1 Tax=Aestuariimicrobium sp. T2.26MG-19.2B TaxID=3040679 RepID=UPI0024778394|nr:PHP domain-containing protein [Aestuariimicrobium sp. T2.26MG-19.2B]CAI9411025.1 phosphatase YcdX [Aestuariimicrobium sp. T2.26MG-19.2B]
MPVDIPAPVAALREVAFWRERRRDETRRVEAYRKAADALAALDADDLVVLHENNAWQSVPGVGPSTAAVIREAMDGRVPPTLAELREWGQTPLAESELRSRLRGDLHTHTLWSDGGSPLEEMVTVAARLGREYIAITDHSPRLRVANGLSAERLQEQWREIERVQAGHDDIRVLRGIEVDILDDGSLDQRDDLLGSLDIVVASVHSKLQMDADYMTRRMVAAIANPYTTVLGHCTGRKVEGGKVRGQSSFDAEVVFAACAQFGVAVEINARPERNDPPDDLLALAHELDCVFSIDTDAHAPGQLDFADLGAARAEAAGIDPDRIITTWPVERLLEFSRRRRAA